MVTAADIAARQEEHRTSGICFANFTVRAAFVSTTTIIPSARHAGSEGAT